MGTKGVTHIFGLDPWESPGMIGQVGNVSRCISYIRASRACLCVCVCVCVSSLTRMLSCPAGWGGS